MGKVIVVGATERHFLTESENITIMGQTKALTTGGTDMGENEIIELIQRIPELKEIGQSYITFKYVELFVIPIAVFCIFGGLVLLIIWAFKKFNP